MYKKVNADMNFKERELEIISLWEKMSLRQIKESLMKVRINIYPF